MINKEERILIRKISICNDARTKELDWQQCRCCVRQNGHCEYHPQSIDTIPYKEAIEIMAKANWIAVVCAKNQIVPIGVSKEEWDAEWDKLRSDYKKYIIQKPKQHLTLFWKEESNENIIIYFNGISCCL